MLARSYPRLIATAIGQAMPAPNTMVSNLGVEKLMMCGNNTAVNITASGPTRTSKATKLAV